MPLIVPCQDLTAGLRLAEAFAWRGRVMLPGGKLLSADDVDVLRRKYPGVVLKVGDPVLDSLVEFEDDARDREAAATSRARVAAAVADVQQRLAGQSAHAGIDYAKSRAVVSDVMEFLSANPVSAAILDRNLDAAGPLAEHTGATFYLAMVLGSAVRDYVARERQRQTSAKDLSPAIAMNLLPLGLGAMFMDVGMMPLAHVFADGYALTDADRKLIRAHPQAGADLLPDSLPTGVKMVVRTHHENFDGSGYPAAMAGPSLHVFTRIARICDAFAAATGRRAFRGAKSPARAVWEMTAGPYRRCYDPVLMKVFSTLIQPFPIGARVQLADGRGAVVVRYNRRDPFRPTVVTAFAAGGDRLAQPEVLTPEDLAADRPTRLAAYAGEDLAFLHEGPAAAAATAGAGADELPPVDSKAFATLLEAAYP